MKRSKFLLIASVASRGSRTSQFPRPVPILANSVLGNGDFEAGDPPTGWGAINGATVSRANGARTGGAGSYLLSAQRGTNNYAAGRATTLVVGDWYQVSIWVKAQGGSVGVELQTVPVIAFVHSAPDWLRIFLTGRTYTASTAVRLQTSSATYPGLYDDALLQKLTLASLFSTDAYAGADCDLSVAYVRNDPLVAAQAGLVARLDSDTNPANFIICYVTPTSSFQVDKCVAGTYTNVITGVVTYEAGKRIRLVCSGNDVSAYYNGVQIGTTQTVSDAGIVSNTRHGLFSTHPSNWLTGYQAL